MKPFGSPNIPKRSGPSLVKNPTHALSIIAWNQSAQTIFGYGEDEILTQPISVLFPTSYTQRLSQTGGCDPLITSGLLRPGARATELNGIKQDGSEFPLEISLSSWETAE